MIQSSYLLIYVRPCQHLGAMRFENPLKPCCFGVDANSDCGDVDANGNNLYTLCEDRTKAFFWDSLHPTDAGWEAVFPILQVTLQQALN